MANFVYSFKFTAYAGHKAGSVNLTLLVTTF